MKFKILLLASMAIAALNNGTLRADENVQPAPANDLLGEMSRPAGNQGFCLTPWMGKRPVRPPYDGNPSPWVRNEGDVKTLPYVPRDQAQPEPLKN